MSNLSSRFYCFLCVYLQSTVYILGKYFYFSKKNGIDNCIIVTTHTLLMKSTETSGTFLTFYVFYVY